MKRLQLMLLALIAALAIHADTVTSLVIQLKDGSTSRFELATKPQVTIDGTNFKLHSDKTDAQIELSTIQRYWFETHDASGITEQGQDQSAIAYEAGTLVLSGLKAGTTAHVYSADGRLTQTLTAHRNGTYRLSLSALPTGVYIVKANSQSFKILKR